MINLGKHTMESYAHILNTNKSILKLNPLIEKLGYRFLWIDASEFERNFSDILSIPKSNKRPLTIIIGREQHGISHELHNALVHTSTFGQMFMHMEYPGIILLKSIDDFNITGDLDDFLIEHTSFSVFYSFVSNLLLQLRLYKVGEIRCSQLFHMTSISRQISLRKTEISIGSRGDYILSDDDVKSLSKNFQANYKTNSLTELAIKNFP
jgi:hypothetical protein